MTKLNVELYGTLLGSLRQTEKGFEFEVNHEVFSKYQLASTIMSLAVPLSLKYTNAQKKRCTNFFAELLPEGRNYEWLAQPLAYEDRNIFGMLCKYGEDIAGALTIYDPENKTPFAQPRAEPVDESAIKYLLEHMPQAALANAPISGKTSLGGVQGKILLARKNALWYRVHNGYPSTHILKPSVPQYPTMIYDEAFCMKMAFESGLTSYPTWIETFDGIDVLVIERYDRYIGDGYSHDGRIHQEDFNQVLGAHGSEKYQEYGGKVSAKRIAQTLIRFGSNEDVEKFASQLIFAVAIGNLDMHAKNVSILHHMDETISLAPTYDQVPLRHHNTDGKMALSIGGEYIHANLTISEIVKELTSWESKTFSNRDDIVAFVRNRLHDYKDALDNTKEVAGSHPQLKNAIASFISNLLTDKKVG